MEYVWESGKNYLRIEMAADGYMSKMLINNDVPGFLKPQYRSRGETEYLCYPVGRLLPLSQILEMKKFSYETFMAFLSSFVKACHGMGDYLLPFAGLVADADYIYGDGTFSEFSWVYGIEPGTGTETERDRDESVEKLFSSLLNKIDYKDDWFG